RAFAGLRGESTTCGTSCADWSNCHSRLGSEVHVIALEKPRPVRRKHPFKATANRPPGSGSGGLANLDAASSDVCARMGPSAAALEVSQRGRRKCVSQPAGQSIEPLIVEVNRIARERPSC